MKTINANTIRKQVIDAITAYFLEAGEDVGAIASNSINFPVVVDGEEGWVEVVVKVPKETSDEEDEGYNKRKAYELKQKEKAQKELERQQKKEADAAKRAAKQKQKGVSDYA